MVVNGAGASAQACTELFINSGVKSKNIIIITERKDSILFNITKKFNLFFIEHRNYIGGRYSVLSEVGMIPAELMGLNSNKFKRFDKLILNKSFVNNLLTNVNTLYDMVKKKRTNSVILNYDKDSSSLFMWYQQLVAESLGKKSNGVFPIISNMPKDNHSLMQLYLDGLQKNFFTFF